MPSKPAHRRGAHGQRPAKRVTDAASADPTTRCWRCHHLIDDCKPHKDGSPAYWQAGHTRDGDPTCPLLAECSTCNLTAGAINRNQRRRHIHPTRQWY